MTFDPYAIMKVKSGADAKRLRRELIRYIWKADDLPDVLPSEVGDPKQTLPFDFDSAYLGHVRRLTQVMELGITTHAYFFPAQNSTHCLFIYHTGHSEPRTAEVRDSMLKRILGGGCDLILAAMPLMHDNPQPIVQTRFGPMWLRDHNALGLLASDTFNPLKVFMQPVLAALNYAIKTHGRYEGIYMAGLSGGGWTTTLYAALDPRIKASFPVAGSLPIALTTFSESRIGDWEQTTALYKVADYLDLYLLGTYPGRTQIQMLNVKDPCCFAGHLSKLYDALVAKTARQWNGNFNVSLDERMRSHDVSTQHMQTIVDTIARLSGIAFPPPPPPVCVRERMSATPLNGPFRNFGGHAYVALLPHLADLADTDDKPQRSPAVLCEDGEPLGPPHTLHVEIEKDGGGTYSHYGGGVVFSTPDNSDPNNNGRQYWIVIPSGASSLNERRD
jgi:hypothetical protein